MNVLRLPRLATLLALGALLCFTGPAARGADRLNWDKKKDRVEAEIDTWPVPKVLQQITAATGWKIFMDPAIKEVVRTKFKNKSPGDALQRLLGDLNYALLPQTNGTSKLLVFRSSQGDATQPVPPPEVVAQKPANHIANELIVTLKPGQKIEDIARQLGAKVIGRADGLNAYRLKFDDADAAKLGRDSLLANAAVEGVDYNYAIPRPVVADPYSGRASGPPALRPKAVTDGKYVIVGLIDSAVQPKEGNFSDFVLPSISVAGESKPGNNVPTHGTSMAETILGSVAEMNAKGDGSIVRILPVDVYGGNASTTSFDVAYGIYKAINAGATIINLSLGSEGDSTFLYDVIKSGHEQGVLFFAAAGNTPVTTPTYPAAYPIVTAVTAQDPNGNISTYANRGTFVDVAAPGSSLISFNGRNWITTGTSTATATTTGMAAALAESSRKPLAEIEATIRKTFAVKKP